MNINFNFTNLTTRYNLMGHIDKETLARITKAVQVQVGVFDRYNLRKNRTISSRADVRLFT